MPNSDLSYKETEIVKQLFFGPKRSVMVHGTGSTVGARLVAARYAMAAAAILLGGAGVLLFGFFALVSLVAFNVVYIVILAPILYAFWQLTRWGYSKYAMRFAPTFYSSLSIPRRTVMAAFLAGLLRLMFDLVRAEKGVEVGDIDGRYAVLFVLVGAILGAGGAAYNNVQHRRRASAQSANAE